MGAATTFEDVSARASRVTNIVDARIRLDMAHLHFNGGKRAPIGPAVPEARPRDRADARPTELNQTPKRTEGTMSNSPRIGTTSWEERQRRPRAQTLRPGSSLYARASWTNP